MSRLAIWALVASALLPAVAEARTLPVTSAREASTRWARGMDAVVRSCQHRSPVVVVCRLRLRAENIAPCHVNVLVRYRNHRTDRLYASALSNDCTLVLGRLLH